VNWGIFVYVCLGIIAIAVVFIYTAKFLFQRKVRQARYVADQVCKEDIDEHDIWLAIDILQTEWERRKLSGNEETNEDSLRILKLLDIWEKTKAEQTGLETQNE